MKKNRKTSRGKLNAAEIEKFKDILLAKRREILGDVSHMEDETLRKPRSDLSNVPFHMADAGTDNYEMEHTLGLMDSEKKILVEIDSALERIDSNTYGICEGDNEPIPKGRLVAIPWARYCVKCAKLAEKGLFWEGPLGQEQSVEHAEYDRDIDGETDSEPPEGEGNDSQADEPAGNEGEGD